MTNDTQPRWAVMDGVLTEAQDPEQSRWAVMDGTLTEAQAAERDAQITPATPTAQEAAPACKHLRTIHSRPGYDPLRPVVITCDDCGAVLSPDAHPPQHEGRAAAWATYWDDGGLAYVSAFKPETPDNAHSIPLAHPPQPSEAVVEAMECLLALVGTPIARRKLNLEPDDERLTIVRAALRALKGGE